MKSLFILSLWFLSWGFTYYDIAKHQLKLVDLVAFDLKRKSIAQFLSFVFPAYFVNHYYISAPIFDIQIPNLLVNILFMVCLFYGLDQIPKLICYGLYKIVNRSKKS
jgi:hypothetical protein